MKTFKIRAGGRDYAVEGKKDENLMRTAEACLSGRGGLVVRRYETAERNDVLPKFILDNQQDR